MVVCAPALRRFRGLVQLPPTPPWSHGAWMRPQPTTSDWRSSSELTSKTNIQVVGDDLFATNLKRLKKGISEKSANAILIKPNQVGTVSETLDAINLAHENKFQTVISHRSGDSEDTFIADLAVATKSSQIKTGSLSRSERVSKYNRLIRIEEELGNSSKIAKI